MNSLPTHVSFCSAVKTGLPPRQRATPAGKRKGPVSPEKQALYRDLSLAVLIPAVDQDSGLGVRTVSGL
jgi:hypothetical protein